MDAPEAGSIVEHFTEDFRRPMLRKSESLRRLKERQDAFRKGMRVRKLKPGEFIAMRRRENTMRAVLLASL